jgi:hypothetical protein
MMARCTGRSRIAKIAQIARAFGREALSYQRGGYILGAALTGPSRSLADRLRSEGIAVLDQEYQRAYATIESDPPAAVTAECALLESVCKTVLEAEGQTLPAKQVLGSLWSETAKNLGLQPGKLADDNLKRILQGLYSLADGVAAIRTHEGSAHGRSGYEIPNRPRYKLLPRHARLAVHAAHTMAMFVLESSKGAVMTSRSASVVSRKSCRQLTRPSSWPAVP